MFELHRMRAKRKKKKNYKKFFGLNSHHPSKNFKKLFRPYKYSILKNNN